MSEARTCTLNRHSSTTAGYGLVEIMVTVVVIGIVIAVVSGNLRSYRESHRMWSQTQQMAAVCKAAQSRARSEDHQILVEYQATEGRYLVVDDENNNSQADVGETVTVHPISDGVQIASTTFVNDRLIFDSRGHAATSGAVIMRGNQDSAAGKRLDIEAGTGHIAISACSISSLP